MPTPFCHCLVTAYAKCRVGRTLLLVTVSLAVITCLLSSVQAQTNTATIATNSLGYLPLARKVATLHQQGATFTVVKATDPHRVVLEGVVEPFVAEGAADSDPKFWTADFSNLQQPGKYELVVPGAGRSAEFEVSSHLYNFPFYTVMRGMYLWRCGCAVAGNHGRHEFLHAACHLEDGDLKHVSDSGGHRDGVGGWHDAGDYNKYTGNGAFTAGMLLEAWFQNREALAKLDLGLPEDDALYPDFLAEVKWELDWLLKMQARDGSAYHKLSTEKFGDFILPENETTARYYCPWGSAATADLVAVMAMASRAFQEFDTDFANDCLESALWGRDFLRQHPKEHRPDQTAFKTGSYNSSDEDDRIWAAAELWETIGDESDLREFEAKLLAAGSRGRRARVVDAVWDWSNLKNLGVFTYLRSQRPGRDPAVVKQVRQALLQSADEIVATSGRNPYGRPLGERYFWGANGSVARQAMNLQLALELTQDPTYQETLLLGLDYLFGRNSYGRSYVTGLGYQPPRFPHDRRSGGDAISAPWPGYLVGGPWPRETDWHDDEEDYRTNEIAINWNGALIYALSGLVDPATFAEDVAREAISHSQTVQE